MTKSVREKRLLRAATVRERSVFASEETAPLRSRL